MVVSSMSAGKSQTKPSPISFDHVDAAYFICKPRRRTDSQATGDNVHPGERRLENGV